MLLWWFIANVDCVLGFWHGVDMGYITEVLDTEAVYEMVATHMLLLNSTIIQEQYQQL
jgi:hypothetical protein